MKLLVTAGKSSLPLQCGRGAATWWTEPLISRSSVLLSASWAGVQTK